MTARDCTGTSEFVIVTAKKIAVKFREQITLWKAHSPILDNEPGLDMLREIGAA
jgi:hypothetical protein